MMQTGLPSLEPQAQADYRAAVDAQLNTMMLDALPYVALASGNIHLMGIAYLLLAPERIQFSAGLLALSALLSFSLFVVLRRLTLAAHHAPAVTAALLALALLNTLHPLFVTYDTRVTVLLMLITISAGLVLMQTFWFGLLLSLGFAGQLIGLLAFSAETSGGASITPAGWSHAGVGLLLSSLLAVAIHVVRRAHCRQIVRLHVHNEAQTASIKRRAAQVEAGRAIARHFNTGGDMDTILQRATDSIGTHYSCTYVGIFLVDDKTGELIARAGIGSAGRAAIQSGARIRIGHGIIGWVAENRRVAYARDTARDPRFVIWDLRPDTRSELTVPLQADEHLLGVLDMQSDQPNAFHIEDVTALQLMADHIGLAVQNLLLQQKAQERHQLMEALHHVGRALSRSMDMQAAFDMILQQIANVIPYDRGSIILQNDALLELVAARGFPGGKRAFRWRIPIRDGDVYDEIRRRQRPLVLDDALRRADWFHFEDLLPARSWMGIPLIREDKVIGMLSLARETYTPFAEDEINFAAVFAWQASIALENARLSVELKQSRDRARQIWNLSENSF